MNSNSTPFKKRNNPFAEINSNPVVVEEPKPVVQVQQPKKTSEGNGREKYTATMDKALRKRVKIASAMAEIDISTFIEEACKEKLEREGF